MGELASTLHLGDSIKLMVGMDYQSLDVVFADPPYGNGTAYNTYEDTRENLKSLVQLFMSQALRVANRVVVTCGVANMWLYPEPTWVLNWTNPSGVGSSSWGFCCWQPILVYGKDPYLADGRGRRSDTFIQRKNELLHTTHPCPKPINVMKWIIERTSRPGELIFDPFMGSGTTGVAAHLMGRGFMGCEIDATYFTEAVNNIAEYRAIQVLPFQELKVTQEGLGV